MQHEQCSACCRRDALKHPSTNPHNTCSEIGTVQLAWQLWLNLPAGQAAAHQRTQTRNSGKCRTPGQNSSACQFHWRQPLQQNRHLPPHLMPFSADTTPAQDLAQQWVQQAVPHSCQMHQMGILGCGNWLLQLSIDGACLPQQHLPPPTPGG